MTIEQQRSQRLAFVDGLRGVAALAVMLYHLVGRTSAGALTQYGFLGVAIFFVLSGFVIASVVGDRRVDAGFLGRFALRRMVRLDIPYWLNIVLAIALLQIAARMGVPKDHIGVLQVGAHLFYLQELLRYTELSPVYWTLCLEVQFYLALILLLWAAQKVQALRFLGPAAVTLLGLSLLVHMGWIPNIVTGFMLPYWWGFALGALCYWYVSGQVQLRYAVLACLLAIATVPATHGSWRLVAAVTAAALVFAWRFGWMGSWLADRVTQFLGRISYSLYLCHPLIGWSAQSFALRYFNQWGALTVGLAASILSSWLAYRFIEKPSIALSHRVSIKAPAALGPGLPAPSAAEQNRAP